MVSDYERRCRRLEALLTPLLARVAALEAQVGYLTQTSTQFRNGGGGGGGYSNITWVYTPVGGIPFATATAGPGAVDTPGGPTMCYSCVKNPATGVWTQGGSLDTPVVNGFTSAGLINAGVGGKFVMVGTEADGTVSCIGDPC